MSLIMFNVIGVNKEHIFGLQSIKPEEPQSEYGYKQSHLLLLNVLLAVLLHLVQFNND